MCQDFKKLFEPIKIGSLEVKNRYVMNAMNLRLEDGEFIGLRVIDFFKERANGGVGLIIAGGFKVEKIASGPAMLGIYDDRHLSGLRDLTSGVQNEGAKIFAQLFHAGRYVRSSEIGQPSVSASSLKSRLTGGVPRALAIAEIGEVVKKYSQAAVRAKDAGFDGIEVISSTGYLISQFLSSLTNKRDDKYGGDLGNRMRFGLEIAEEIRKEVGTAFPLIFRISGHDFMQGGNTNKDACIFAKALEELGVDAINVQTGWHESRVPTVQQVVPQGAFVYLARGIKDQVSCPVITSNKFGDPYLAEETLKYGYADLIGMARPFLADPYLPQKVQDGRIDEIVRCISCNQGCLDMVFTRRPVTCMVNPLVGKERDWQLKPARTRKKVLVVGGGPGGMAAAKIAAMRGHEVHLYEKAERLGGQINLARILPDKGEFGLMVDDLRTHAIKNGVEVKTGIDVTPEIVEQFNPDAVVVATGAKQRPHSIKGAESGNVFDAIQVLENEIEIGRKAVIIGGGSLGCEIALFLAVKGAVNCETLSFLLRTEAEDIKTLRKLGNRGAKEVTLITRRDGVGKDIGQSTRWVFLQEFKRLNVRIITKAEEISIADKGVRFNVCGAGKEVPADAVIISPGMQSINELYEHLRHKEKEVYLVGDAKEPRKALEAIYEGTQVGYAI